MLHRGNPYLAEQVHAPQYFHRGPEHDDRGDGHADVRAPRGNAQLLGEDEERPYQAAQPHEQGYGMVVAEEHVIVAEHQQQVRAPQNHHQFHEGHDAGVACHGACGNVVLPPPEQQPLPPVDEVAAVLRAEQVHDHYHHPEPERGGHDEVFGPRHHLARHGVELRLRAEAVGEVHEKELHPARPEQQAAEQPPKGLPRVALGKHADDDHRHAHRAHRKGGIVEHGLAHQVFHHNHQRMSQRHGEQYQKEGGGGFPPVKFLARRRARRLCRFSLLFHNVPTVFV